MLYMPTHKKPLRKKNTHITVQRRSFSPIKVENELQLENFIVSVKKLKLENKLSGALVRLLKKKLNSYKYTNLLKILKIKKKNNKSYKN